jgi:hypothetical protein
VWAVNRERVLGLPSGAPRGELEEREDLSVSVWRGSKGGLTKNAPHYIVLCCAVPYCVLL